MAAHDAGACTRRQRHPGGQPCCGRLDISSSRSRPDRRRDRRRTVAPRTPAEAARQLLQRPDRPTAVLCFSDVLGLGSSGRPRSSGCGCRRTSRSSASTTARWPDAPARSRRSVRTSGEGPVRRGGPGDSHRAGRGTTDLSRRGPARARWSSSRARTDRLPRRLAASPARATRYQIRAMSQETRNILSRSRPSGDDHAGRPEALNASTRTMAGEVRGRRAAPGGSGACRHRDDLGRRFLRRRRHEATWTTVQRATAGGRPYSPVPTEPRRDASWGDDLRGT